MKTTIEIPEHLFRKAKAEAALRGHKLKELIIAGLKKELQLETTDLEDSGNSYSNWQNNVDKIRKKLQIQSKTNKTLRQILIEDRK